MPRISPIQNDFSSGEISPRLHGRVESPHYKTGLDTCKNWIPLLQGPAVRRSGTSYVAATKGVSNDLPILIPFKFSNTQSYVLEVGDNYTRFYRNNAQILSSGTPVEIATPWRTADLNALRWTQSNDVLYVVHASYPPVKIIRTSDTVWTWSYLQFNDGPYLGEQVSGADYSVAPNINANAGNTFQRLGPEVQLNSAGATAAGGTVVITTEPAYTVTGAANNGAGLIRIQIAGGFAALAAWTGQTLNNILVDGVLGCTEANGVWKVTIIDNTHFDLVGSTFVHAWSAGAGQGCRPAVFSRPDGAIPYAKIGRVVRLEYSSTWGWGYLIDFLNPGSVTLFVPNVKDNKNAANAIGAGATYNWRLGLYGSAQGFPSITNFYQGRLFFAAGPHFQTRLDGSQSEDFENFGPTEYDGTVTDADAVGFSLESNDANPIEWISYNETGLVVGTTSSEWLVGPSNAASAFSATNIQAQQSTFYGSAQINAVQAGKATVMVQTAGRQIRELMYYYYLNGFRGEDITLLSEHITGGGLSFIAFQRVPTPIIWAIRSDGQLIGCSYERGMQDLKVGWHEHELGGYSFKPFTAPLVKRLAVIASANGLSEDLWILTQRQINGTTVKYIEYLTQPFDENVLQENAVCVDCSLSYDLPVTVTAISTAAQPVVTAAGHGLSNDDQVVFRGLLGSNFAGWNYNIYTVTGVSGATFKLTELTGLSLDVSIPFQASGATVRKRVSTISGLSHLNGESVYAWCDGAVQGPFTVTANAITLSQPACTVTVGYNYNSDLKMLRIEGGAADGTALGKIRRINRMRMLFYRVLGLKIGSSFTSMEDLIFETTSSGNGVGPALFSGIFQNFPDFDYDYENQICIRASTPAPATILAIMPQQETQDAG